MHLVAFVSFYFALKLITRETKLPAIRHFIDRHMVRFKKRKNY